MRKVLVIGWLFLSFSPLDHGGQALLTVASKTREACEQRRQQAESDGWKTTVTCVLFAEADAGNPVPVFPADLIRPAD